MLRAVIDTNVLVSALLSETGSPAAICRAFERGHFVWCLSDVLLSEYQSVLARPHLRTMFARHDEGLVDGRRIPRSVGECSAVARRAV